MKIITLLDEVPELEIINKEKNFHVIFKSGDLSMFCRVWLTSKPINCQSNTLIYRRETDDYYAADEHNGEFCLKLT